MTTRTFIFCDICNPDGIRTINNRYGIDCEDADHQSDTEAKRALHERREFDGRRISDGRAWHEGTLESSLEQGWWINDKNEILCPKCYRRHQLDTASTKKE